MPSVAPDHRTPALCLHRATRRWHPLSGTWEPTTHSRSWFQIFQVSMSLCHVDAVLCFGLLLMPSLMGFGATGGIDPDDAFSRIPYEKGARMHGKPDCCKYQAQPMLV